METVSYYLVTYTEICVAVIGITGVILGAIITHIFDRAKIKKERKARYEDVVGSKVADALQKTRKMQRHIRSKELYDIDMIADPSNSIDFMSPELTYPSIFNTPEDFFGFQTEISNIRTNYEEFLTYKEAALLIVIENYCMNILAFATKEQVKDFQFLGALISNDLWKWHIYFDKTIVKDNNKQRCKLVSHSGLKWKTIRKYIIYRFWKRSILYGMQKGLKRKKSRDCEKKSVNS